MLIIINLTEEYLESTIILVEKVIQNNFQSSNFKGKDKIINSEVKRISENLRESISDLNNHNFNFKIILEDENVIGLMGFSNPSQIIIDEIGNNYIEIISAYILPEKQGMGYGGILVKEILKELKLQNIKKIALYTGYPGSIGFWTTYKNIKRLFSRRQSNMLFLEG